MTFGRIRPPGSWSTAIRSQGVAALGAALLGVAGCAHRDVVDTPVGWWHQLEGGAIAEQRPPPPGENDPYPKIGTTPEHAPQVASLDLRRSVTNSLLSQRNLTARLDANDPIAMPVAPVRPAARGNPGASSATLDAAQGSHQAAPHPGGGQQDVPPVADPQPELALPAVQVPAASAQGVGSQGAVTMPAIPGAPPPPPRLRGLALPASLPGALPAYRVAPADGTPIAFVPGSDTLLSGQLGPLHAIAARRGTGTILVHGYGEASSSDPETQAQALSVAALRARAVAEALQTEGVPAASILLRAEAFGRGASVTLVQ